MKPGWYIDGDNSVIENAKRLDSETWLERFIDRLAEEFRPDKEQLELYVESLRNKSV